MLDKDEKIVAVQPSENGTQQVVGILSMAYDSMKVSGGGTVDIDEPEKTEVWQDGKATTYDKVYLSGLAAGTQAVLQSWNISLCAPRPEGRTTPPRW